MLNKFLFFTIIIITIITNNSSMISTVLVMERVFKKHFVTQMEINGIKSIRKHRPPRMGPEGSPLPLSVS